jgi:hypothetical protein
MKTLILSLSLMSLMAQADPRSIEVRVPINAATLDCRAYDFPLKLEGLEQFVEGTYPGNKLHGRGVTNTCFVAKALERFAAEENGTLPGLLTIIQESRTEEIRSRGRRGCSFCDDIEMGPVTGHRKILMEKVSLEIEGLVFAGEYKLREEVIPLP